MTIRLSDLRFGWHRAEDLLRIPLFEQEQGEQVLLRGSSGSGKTTFLSIVCGILRPQQGSVSVLGADMRALSGRARDRLRGEKMGVIFQQFNLLPYLSVRDNVLLPARLFHARRAVLMERSIDPSDEVLRLLQAMGLPATIADRPAYRLSVGEQQRVAAARALLGSPPLIIADEPTSALDEESQKNFLATLMTQVRMSGASLLMVSHQSCIGSSFDRIISLSDLCVGPEPVTADAVFAK
jgi:putative ABC transport system ATP-binding protein